MVEEMLGAFMAPYGSDFALWGGGGVWRSPYVRPREWGDVDG